MIRDVVMQMAASDPSFAKGVDAIERQLGASPIVPEDLDEAIQLLEFVIQHPDKYAEIRDAAIQDGLIDEKMVPPQYDQSFIVSMLIALYGLQDRLSQKMARGGLAFAARKIATGGRGGDSELVHVNRREKEMLRRMGGSGDINPNTGLREYKSGKQILGAVLPIALGIFLPGLGVAIGSALGASGVGASIVGGAIIGAGSSAIGGGNVLQGALMGGLGGGLGGAAGGVANKALGLNLGTTGQAILGSGLVGAGAGLATGQGALKGAVQGVAGGALGELAGQLGGTNAFSAGVKAAGQTAGQTLTAGYDPKTALVAGGLQGLAAGIRFKPSDQVVQNLEQQGSGGEKRQLPTPSRFDPETGEILVEPYMQTEVSLPGGKTTTNIPGSTGIDAAGKTGTYVLNSQTGAVEFRPDAGSYQFDPQSQAVKWQKAEPSFWEKAMAGGPLESSSTGAVGATGAAAKPNIFKTATTALPLLAVGASLMGGQQASPQVQQEITKLNPQQQEYFNRPSVSWDWDKLQRDASLSNMSLSDYMARNWNSVTSGAYNSTPMPQMPGMPEVPKMAMGGALNQVARFARGAGSGRADTINARLSDGEYVMDAETVAMLGDGSSEEGARKLDAMREKLRRHKGKALAKGKFSPNAKSPLNYIKGVA